MTREERKDAIANLNVIRVALIDAVTVEQRKLVDDTFRAAIIALEQEPDAFTKWVAREIFDDEWEYNKDAFAEIACRKLAKLGIVRTKGDEWELVEQESCDTCEHSDEIDGSNCYECIKGIRDRYHPQPCDNAVSRQAVLDVLSFCKEMLSRVLDEIDVVGTDREKYSWGLGLIESIIKDINELPPVNPQPKTGHWIKMPLIEGGQSYSHECSECGRKILTIKENLSEFPYCHCGAKMVEPQESEDEE